MNPDDKRPREQAHEILLSRYLTGNTSKEEQEQVEAWLASSEENPKLLNQLAYIHQAKINQKKAASWDAYDALDQVEHTIQQQAKRRFFRRCTAAASILLFIGVTLFLCIQKKVNLNGRLITISSEDQLRKAYTLPDGTRVWLNGGSVLRYRMPFGEKERRITLDGEAYFEVAENPTIPFLVHLDKGLDIQVLGTAFNVYAYADAPSVQTTLLSGSVALRFNDQMDRRILKPAEKAVFFPEKGQMTIDQVDPESEREWMYNRLVFTDTPMPLVMDRLSRFYNVFFKLKDDGIRHYTFTGTFENKPLAQVLQYMEIASDISYTKIEPKNNDQNAVPVIELKMKR